MNNIVITPYESECVPSDFALAAATEKIAEMGSDDTPISQMWAKVYDANSTTLLYKVWFDGGMLHTLNVATGHDEECILFLK